MIFLDRDGTLIVNKHYLNSVEGIEYLPGVFEALQSLKSKGFEFVMVTNQSGIPRGLITESQLMAIHDQMRQDFADHGLEFLGLYHAPHLPDSNHEDRKPNPGMLLKAYKKFGIDMKHSWMIGDSSADVGAGKNAGVKTILITSDTNQESIHKKADHTVTHWAQIDALVGSD